MSEKTKKEYDPWDPESHSADSFMDGKTVQVTEAEFKRDSGRQGNFKEKTVISVRYRVDDLADEKQPYPVNYSVGDSQWPSVDGKTKEVSGPRIVSVAGKKVSKKALFHAFTGALKASGFPMQKLADEGAEALIGARFVMAGRDFSWNIDGEKTEKTYDLPSEFLGFAGNGSAKEEPEITTAEIAELESALVTELQAAGGSIPRGQLSVRLNKALKDSPNRVALLGLATKDETLGQISGITFDRKTVTLAQQ